MTADRTATQRREPTGRAIASAAADAARGRADRRRPIEPGRAYGLLHRHDALHRLQGLRGGLQGVEPAARGRPRASPGCRYDNTGALGATTWRHVAFVGAAPPKRATAALPLADVMATSASTAPTPPASTSARPARSSAPSSAPSSCSRTLQRLRLLRAGLPLRRDRPARGATAGPTSARSATTG